MQFFKERIKKQEINEGRKENERIKKQIDELTLSTGVMVLKESYCEECRAQNAKYTSD